MKLSQEKTITQSKKFLTAFWAFGILIFIFLVAIYAIIRNPASASPIQEVTSTALGTLMTLIAVLLGGQSAVEVSQRGTVDSVVTKERSTNSETER